MNTTANEIALSFLGQKTAFKISQKVNQRASVLKIERLLIEVSIKQRLGLNDTAKLIRSQLPKVEGKISRKTNDIINALQNLRGE
jgi:hypothetical protein